MKSRIQHGSDGVETDSSEEEMKLNINKKGLKSDKPLQNVDIQKNKRPKKTLKYYGKPKKGSIRSPSPTKENNIIQRQNTKSPDRARINKAVKGSSNLKIPTMDRSFRSKDEVAGNNMTIKPTNEPKSAENENKQNNAVEPDQGIITTSNDSLLIHGLARDWVEDEMSEDPVFM